MTINALQTASAGLRLTQAQIGIVSQNVANAGTVGYVRRTLDAVTTGPRNDSVASGTVARTLDAAALKQLRLETSGAAYTAVNAGVRTSLDALYGIPGDSTALDGMLNGFASSLQALAANPSASATRSAVVDSAMSLAAKIGGIANGVQDLRSAMEAQIGADTASASDLLSSIATLNTKIAGTGDDAGRADLLDQRDQALNSLSALMDVQVVGQRSGTVTVITGSGVTLVEGGNAASLSFDDHGSLTAGAAYATDPAKRGVGTITARTPGGATIDLVAGGAIRSGSLAAAIEARDTILPQAQRQLDDLAAGLSRAMSDAQETGTAVTSGTKSGFEIDLAGLKAGNTITLSLKDTSGVNRTVIVVPSNLSSPASPEAAQTEDGNATIVSFTLPQPYDAATFNTRVQTALRSALGTSVTVDAGSNGSTRILSDSASGNLTLLSASASVTRASSATQTANGSAQLPLFVDTGRNSGLYTGSFDGGSQLTGFAQRIAVNLAVRSNTANLVAMSASTATGDATRPQALYDALTATRRGFSSSSGIGGIDAPYSGSVLDFAQEPGGGADGRQQRDDRLVHTAAALRRGNLQFTRANGLAECARHKRHG